jgi:hypothetical protein
MYPSVGETPRSRAKPNRRRKSRNAASSGGSTNNNTPQRRKPPSLSNDDFNASVIANGSLPYPCDDLVSALQSEGGGGAKLCYSVGNSPYRAYSTPPRHHRLAQPGEPPEPPLRGPSSYNGVRAGGSLHSFRQTAGFFQ